MRYRTFPVVYRRSAGCRTLNKGTRNTNKTRKFRHLAVLTRQLEAITRVTCMGRCLGRTRRLRQKSIAALAALPYLRRPRRPTRQRRSKQRITAQPEAPPPPGVLELGVSITVEAGTYENCIVADDRLVATICPSHAVSPQQGRVLPVVRAARLPTALAPSTRRQTALRCRWK